jgi:hypothetical protein
MGIGGTRSVLALMTAVALSGASVGIVAEAAGGGRQSLVGTWGKSISEAAWTKAHIAGEAPGHYAIKVAASGLTSMYDGNDPTMATVTIPFTTMRIVASGDTVTVGPTADAVCHGKGTYRWAVAGSLLKFTLVNDGCRPPRVIMTAGAFTLEH